MSLSRSHYIGCQCFHCRQETAQERANHLLREYQQAQRAVIAQHPKTIVMTVQQQADRWVREHIAFLDELRPVTATVNPFPSFAAAKASDMTRVQS